MNPLPSPPARIHVHYVGGGPLDGGSDHVTRDQLATTARFHERTDGAYQLVAIRRWCATAEWQPAHHRPARTA